MGLEKRSHTILRTCQTILEGRLETMICQRWMGQYLDLDLLFWLSLNLTSGPQKQMWVWLELLALPPNVASPNQPPFPAFHYCS